jgi:hypothetical protein
MFGIAHTRPRASERLLGGQCRSGVLRVPLIARCLRISMSYTEHSVTVDRPNATHARCEGDALNKLDVLQAIDAGGFERQAHKDSDVEEILAFVDQLEAEGLIHDVYRYRHSDSEDMRIISVRVGGLPGRGDSYVNAMGE